MKKMLWCIVMGCILDTVHAQDTIQNSKPSIEFSGYIDGYYSYDFSDVNNLKTKPFQYNYARHNEFSINIALLKASISYQNVYAKIALQAGTYVRDNYGNTNLFNEAYLGVYLDKNQKTSVEAGILPSYIGFETATSHSNLTTTRSLQAENSPYYMTGLKFNQQWSEKLFFSAMFSNGWQLIDRVSKKALPTFGTQLQYKKSDRELFNWSTFIGDYYQEDYLRTRYFSDLYWDKQWNDKWRTIASFDLGFQKKFESADFSSWWSSTIITKYSISKRWDVAYRNEYFSDIDNVVIDVYGIIPREFVPFKVLGNSINLDFLPNSKTKIRTEAKWYNASEPIFDNKKDNYVLTTTFSFEF